MLLKLRLNVLDYKLAFLDLILPDYCIICNKRISEKIMLCPSCIKRINMIESPICPKCGLPYTKSCKEDHLCGRCLKDKMFFDKAWQVGYYNGVLRKTITSLKYNGKTGISSYLGKLMATKIVNEKNKIDYHFLIPVPLHMNKIKGRGYNQSYFLAKEVGKILKLKVEFKNLSKIIDAPSQTGLSIRERKKNVKETFYLKNSSRIQNKKILLIDDVYTSGATINECARVLKRGGAETVDVLTLGRVA